MRESRVCYMPLDNTRLRRTFICYPRDTQPLGLSVVSLEYPLASCDPQTYAVEQC